MLHHHREVRHGSYQPRDSAFTPEELNRLNYEHDRKMGWSLSLPTLYTNPLRLPETHVGSIKDVFA